MKNIPSTKPTAKSGQFPGAHESPESIKTFPLRSKRPGQVGLANEARPGLGTRATEDRGDQPTISPANQEEDGSNNDRLPEPPVNRPEPSEQDPASLAQEEERETGVSGHLGGT